MQDVLGLVTRGNTMGVPSSTVGYTLKWIQLTWRHMLLGSAAIVELAYAAMLPWLVSTLLIGVVLLCGYLAYAKWKFYWACVAEFELLTNSLEVEFDLRPSTLILWMLGSGEARPMRGKIAKIRLAAASTPSRLSTCELALRDCAIKHCPPLELCLTNEEIESRRAGLRPFWDDFKTGLH